MLSGLELTGRSDRHVVGFGGEACRVHRRVVKPLRRLTAAAAREGIELVACSAYRNFEGQLGIWNAKYLGRRPLYDRSGLELDHARLSEPELFEAILAWSALPGGSRHHWGTDIDVIDRAALPEGCPPRLMPDEYAPGGVFERLAGWLDSHLAEFEFFRPFRTPRGGVNPEPWHLSYAPVSVPALEALSVDLLAEALGDPRLLGRERLLTQVERLHRRYVANIDPP